MGSVTTIAMPASHTTSVNTSRTTAKPLGAKRHADADLAGSLCGYIGQHAVEANRRQQRRQYAEAHGQHRDQPVVGNIVGNLLIHGAHGIDHKLGAGLLHGVADGRSPLPRAPAKCARNTA